MKCLPFAKKHGLYFFLLAVVFTNIGILGALLLSFFLYKKYFPRFKNYFHFIYASGRLS
jgi:hypothetical protein